MDVKTVASIAKGAMDAVSRKIGGVIHAAMLTRTIEGAYDPATGTQTSTTETDSGRLVLASETPVADIFPDYVPGPSEGLAYFEGLTVLAPAEGDAVTAGGVTYAVLRVRDILGAGGLYALVVRG